MAAIAKLGYKAKPPTQGPSKRASSTLTGHLPIPADAPPFFVEAIDRARAAKRPMVIDFWAEWCVTCLRLKRETLEHPDVVKALRSVELIYVDLDKYPTLGEAFEVNAIPDVIFVDESGRIVDRLHNFEPPAVFVARLRRFVRPPPNVDATGK